MLKFLIFILAFFCSLSCSMLRARPSNFINTRVEIVNEAEKFQGVPYKKDGKNPYTGFDCSGFASYIYSHFNIKLLGSSQDIASLGVMIDREDVKAGDLVFFGQKRSGDFHITHVGIVTRKLGNKIEMIHSSSSIGISKDIIDDSEYWNTRYLFAKDILSKKSS